MQGTNVLDQSTNVLGFSLLLYKVTLFRRGVRRPRPKHRSSTPVIKEITLKFGFDELMEFLQKYGTLEVKDTSIPKLEKSLGLSPMDCVDIFLPA